MNSNQYLVKYFPDPKTHEEELYLVYEKGLFEWLERAKEEKILIVVYQVGDCLLDWS